MDKLKQIKISEFTYELPEERIAKYPLRERDQSKLLVWDKGQISESIFEACTQYIPEGAHLIFNNTRVIHARLFFHKETGAKIEIFCLEPVSPADYQLAFQQTQRVSWKCMIGNSKKWKQGELVKSISIDGQNIALKARKENQTDNTFEVTFEWDGNIHFSKIIEHAGQLPIPPYLNRETEESDEQTYQTVYAKVDGSVAAPTAGLHFTDKVLHQLTSRKIKTGEVTLHVGAGTFQPVKSETIDGHTMHHEMVIIDRAIVQSLLDNPLVIAVGTTSVRSLESLYWIGVQLEEGTFNEEFAEIKQWEPYHKTADLPTTKALQNVLDYLDSKQLPSIRFSTQIIIVPGYQFRIIRGMFTNFHQPQSTLLLLISAFLGEEWRTVYNYALENNFRFLSYGDSNLYLR